MSCNFPHSLHGTTKQDPHKHHFIVVIYQQLCLVVSGLCPKSWSRQEGVSVWSIVRGVPPQSASIIFISSSTTDAKLCDYFLIRNGPPRPRKVGSTLSSRPMCRCCSAGCRTVVCDNVFESSASTKHRVICKCHDQTTDSDILLSPRRQVWSSSIRSAFVEEFGMVL
jgi:hypothetical protein